MNRQRLLPYAFAVLAILIAYPVVLLVMNRQMLAVCVSAVGALAAFSICRVVQTRGKVSLALLTIGLPLVVACACLVYQRLSLFSQRQATADQLRAVGVAFRQRSPELVGEWSVDKTGKQLPVWLVNKIGPDAMAPISALNAIVEDLHGIELQSIDTSLLSRVELTCRGDGAITPELIDWLNRCDKLDSLKFRFSNFTGSDGEGLSRLEKEWHAEFVVAGEEADLSNVGSPSQFFIDAVTLTPVQAKQLSRAVKSPTAFIGLRLKLLTADVVKELSGMPYLCVTAGNLDEETVAEIAKLGMRNLEFNGSTFATSLDQMSFDAETKTEFLRLTDCSVTIEDCISMCNLFQCKGLTVVETLGKRLTDEEIQRLWECENLENVGCYRGGWEYFENPKLKDKTAKTSTSTDSE